MGEGSAEGGSGATVAEKGHTGYTVIEYMPGCTEFPSLKDAKWVNHLLCNKRARFYYFRVSEWGHGHGKGDPGDDVSSECLAGEGIGSTPMQSIGRSASGCPLSSALCAPSDHLLHGANNRS